MTEPNDPDGEERSAAELAEAVPERSGRRRGRALAVVGAACATVAAIVVPLVVSGNSSSGRTGAGPSGAAPSARAPSAGTPSVGGSPSAAETPPPGEQIVAFHGIEITVPTSWHINDTKCGTPIADSVVRDEGATPACDIPQPANVSSVQLMLGPFPTSMQQMRTVTNEHAVRLERGVGPGGVVGVAVPDAGVFALIKTVPAAQTEQIIDSIRLVDVDANGCATRQTALDPPATYRPADQARLAGAVIPSGATAIAICHYLDNWLASSMAVTGDELAKLPSVVNHLPPGFARVDPGTFLPSICTETSAGGGEKGSGFLLTARYANQPDVPLWLHIGFCGNLGITNGIRSGQLTPKLAETIASELHTGVGFPGDLLPGSSASPRQ